MTLGEDKVQGFVLTFANSDVLSLLDELEDYQPHRTPELNEYNRQLIEAYTCPGKPLGWVWVYLMSFERVGRLRGILLPSGCWSGEVL